MKECPLLHIDLIPLTQGKYAIVDKDVYGQLSKYKWRAQKAKRTFYAMKNCNETTVAMHRIIMDAPLGLVVDHKNGNGLDNRKINLRICTNAQNCQNRCSIGGKSQFKGVDFHHNKWRARIKINGRKMDIGHFLSEVDAAKAYDTKAMLAWGQFARLNFAASKTVGENTVLGNKNHGKEVSSREVRKTNPIGSFGVSQAVVAM